MCALLVEFVHESCILASTYQVIRLDELKAVIMCDDYVALSVSILDRFLWVPNFPLSTIGTNDHSHANEPLLHRLNPLWMCRHTVIKVSGFCLHHLTKDVNLLFEYMKVGSFASESFDGLRRYQGQLALLWSRRKYALLGIP